MSKQELRAYIDAKLPMLGDALGPMANDDVRQVLNAATGLRFWPTSPLHDSCKAYYIALLRMERNKTLTLIALPKAIRKVADLRLATSLR